MSSFGKKLFELRKKSNLSQVTVAEALDLSVATISRYEREQIIPTEEIIVKTSLYFNVSSDYLLGLSSYPKGDKELIKDYERIKEKASKYDELMAFMGNQNIFHKNNS